MITEEEIKAVGNLIRDVADRAESALRAGRSVQFDVDHETMLVGAEIAFARRAHTGRRTYTIHVHELVVPAETQAGSVPPHAPPTSLERESGVTDENLDERYRDAWARRQK